MKTLFRTLLACFLCVGVTAGCNPDPTLPQVVRRTVNADDGPYSTPLRTVYDARNGRPAWVDRDGLTSNGQALLRQLCQADREGLDPGAYPLDSIARVVYDRYGAGGASASRRETATLEVSLARLMLAYTDDLMNGRTHPSRVGGKWLIPDAEQGLAPRMQAALDEGPARYLDRLPETHRRYAGLRRAFRDYRAAAADGSWPEVPAGPRMDVGMRGPRVDSLRRRLVATGDLGSTAPRTVYTDAVANGVQHFEQRHGLPVDGAVSDEDRRALNVSAARRAQQLELNLERHRWLPEDLGRDYVFVNLTDYRLTAYRDGRPALDMPVVVGKDGWETVAFADTMTHAVFGPQWHVPRSIAKKDVLPAVQQDSTFLQRRNYQVLGASGDTLGSGALTKKAVQRGEVQLVQKAGPGNALGRVKFLFPNEHAIYFHDTPAQAAFNRTDRAESHGCVRLDDPLAFAEYAFDEDRLPRDSLGTLMDESSERREWLGDPLPVYMVYLTAWTSPDGTVQFRNDVYDNDADLRHVLGSPKPALNACSVLQNSTQLGSDPLGLPDSTGRRF